VLVMKRFRLLAILTENSILIKTSQQPIPMKEIVAYVREFLHERGHPGYVATLAGMLSILFFLNYRFDFEASITGRFTHPALHAVFYFFFYAVPYFAAHAAFAFWHNDFGFMRQWKFWTLSSFCLAVLSVYIPLHDVPGYLLQAHSTLFESVAPEFRRFAVRCLSNVLPLAIAFFPVLLYWRAEDRREMPLYGMSARSISLPSYFLLLVFLAPVIFGVSFTSDFQAAYPRYKFGFPVQVTGVERGAYVGAFEVCYGLDFVFVEFFFRGFMVLGFARLLGTRAIIPMVVVYALIHFEKPLLEAVSSVFGGLALGVIAYRTKSVYGGVILHLGVAFMMEIAGTTQMILRQ
jgi:hypothetical protein